MQRFTDAYIRGLKPRTKRYIVREDAPRGEGGFCIRVMPTGAKSWQMIYTFQGSRKWLQLGEYPGMSLSRAREEFRKMRKILAGGDDPGEVTRTKNQERRDAWTVDKLAEEFLEKYCRVKKRPRSAKEDELNLKRDVRTAWGKKKARDIRRGDVVTLLDEIVKRGAGVQANRTLSTVRKMFAWGLEREVVEFNPASGISKPAAESPKERALTMEEIKIAWRAMDQAEDVPRGVKTALKLILLTGCRPGEILSARWDQVAGSWLELPGTSTKNKKPHRVFLSSLSKEVLGEDGSGLLITKADGSQIPVYSLSSWLRNRTFFGLSPWSAHDLRRTCATRLAEMEVAPHIIVRLLNHAQTGVTGKHYDKYTYAKEISRAMEKWGRKLEQTITGQAPDNVIQLPQSK
jgi:integrase